MGHSVTIDRTSEVAVVLHDSPESRADFKINSARANLIRAKPVIVAFVLSAGTKATYFGSCEERR
jgi:hypothetical protein